MTREEKRQFVKQWNQEIKEVPFAVLVDYRGLSVADVTELRTKLKESNSNYRVVKNSLARLAAPGTALEALTDYFDGPIAVAYNAVDPVGMAKALVGFAKDKPALEIRCGVVDGRLLESGQIEELSKLPSREELLGKLLYLLIYPIQGLASTLNNIVRNLAVVLGQVAGSKN